MKIVALQIVLSGLLLHACKSLPVQQIAPMTDLESSAGPISYEQEEHLANIRQLTFGANNAEAYWNFAGTHLVFQSDNPNWGAGCDQIFILDISEKADSLKRKRLSTGLGRTTCSWFMPDGRSILYASTHLAGDSCPPEPPRNGKYTWALYESYDIFVAGLDGTISKQLTFTPRYDAEATVSPAGDKIVFTSLRNGDLDLYTMNLDGSDVKQITHTLGYDGGACFSPDGKKIVWRASRPVSKDEIREYRDLLDRNLVEPGNLEIWVANADGSSARQITNLGKANWAPTFTPDGNRILFCSNYKSERGFPFNLYLIGLDGSSLEQVTFDTEFDSFPMFSPDGRKLVWCSNRHNGRTRDTNVFIADWKN